MLAVAGCVNNYVLVETEGGDGGGTGDAEQTMGGDGNTECSDPVCATTTTTDDADATNGDASSSSSSSSGDPSASGDPTGTGDPTEGGPGTTDDPGPALCEPCTSDPECVGDSLFCAPVPAMGNLCLRPCSEQEPPCAPEFGCEDVQSVDGAMVALCVPVGADCPAGEGSGS